MFAVTVFVMLHFVGSRAFLNRSKLRRGSRIISTGHQIPPAFTPKLSLQDEQIMTNFKDEQKRINRPSYAEDVRTLIDQSIGYGVLSTNSIQYTGYPMGSVVGFHLDPSGFPFFSLSTLSTHTTDLLRDNKASLTILAKDFHGAADGRVVLLGEVKKVRDPEQCKLLREQYLTKHKDAYWIDFGDFSYFHMEKLEAIRYVGGFALAGDVTVQEYLAATPDPLASYSAEVVKHMNEDHASSIAAMVAHHTKHTCTEAIMTHIDKYGFMFSAMITSSDLAVSMSALCLAYNATLTFFRFSTYEINNKSETIATSACALMLNMAVYALKDRKEDSMLALQLFLTAGTIAIVNTDRLRNVVGRYFRDENLSGKVYIITGSNTGIGYETAKALLLQKSTVIMACRSLTKANEAKEKLLRETNSSPAQIKVIALDLCDFTTVHQFVKEFKRLRLPLHGLINNAGLMMDKREVTSAGHEVVFTANHLSHFLLSNLLLSELEHTGGRIVTLTSSLHQATSGFNFDDIMTERNYEMFSNYAQSKLANLLFTRELTRRLQAQKSSVTCYAVHPGCVRTEVTRHMHPLMQLGNALFAPILATLQKTPEQGAFSSVYVAMASELTRGANRERYAGQLFFHCRPIEMGAAALDDEAAKRLWEISQKLTGL